MKSLALRQYIKVKNLTSSHVLKDCDLVIDGASYFRDTYKKSGCHFLSGADCDRYANFIINKLNSFLDSKIKCYVVFNGDTKHDLDKIQEFHQTIIYNRSYDKQNLDNAEYLQPLFVKDVEKQVLEKMEIKYFVSEYDSIEAIVGVARKFKCPVLTDNIEYSLFRVSCIPVNSLEYDEISEEFKCKIYEHGAVTTAFGVYGKMPILLTLLNKEWHIDLEELNGDFFRNIKKFEQSGALIPMKKWVKRQREAVVVEKVKKIICDKDQKEAFMEMYEKIQTLYLYPSCHLAVNYFQREKLQGLFKDDKKWFAKGVSNGRIAPPYVNLKKKGMVCGSLIVNDRNQPDALMAAMDIIIYSHCILTNSQDSKITFFGRKCNRSTVREIVTERVKEISNRNLFSKHNAKKKLNLIIDKYKDPFQIFLGEILPGYDYDNHLARLPENCRILVLTLVYYISKKNCGFINEAYGILLSYVMLGPVSKNIDALKDKDCEDFYNGLKFLFKKLDGSQFNSSIVHNFSEFQHCLQQMNYLNKLCGEEIPCTVYHATYNATFIYNTLLFMKDKDNLMKFLENKFMESKYLRLYKRIVTDFEKFLSFINLFS